MWGSPMTETGFPSIVTTGWAEWTWLSHDVTRCLDDESLDCNSPAQPRAAEVHGGVGGAVIDLALSGIPVRGRSRARRAH
jgi:hypothetical protein